jgi:hypothetical protein
VCVRLYVRVLDEEVEVGEVSAARTILRHDDVVV